VLGSHFVHRLAEQGAQVLATCSSQDSAARIPELAALKLLLDLRSNESISVLANYLNQTHQIDGVVLASGRVGFAKVADTDPSRANELMHINHLGPSQLVIAVLENLLRASNPFLISITGVVSEKNFPGMSAYSVSKRAHAAWLEFLSMEHSRSGLFVLDAKPGHTETGLATRPLFGTAPNMPTGMQPEHVVDRILKGLAARTLLTSLDF
jgi:cyclic-di-GMP-binding biofilm dispersal mediator protein